MTVRIINSIKDVNKEQWDELNTTASPFLMHDFFLALEESKSSGVRSGWFPSFILVEDNNQLLAACALYIKNNSYGEYIFDWSWAEAYARNNLPYYPKLVAAIPFTPATTPKLLIKDHTDEAARSLLIDEIMLLSDQASSFHSLFIPEKEVVYYKQRGMKVRHTMQYHWKNSSYNNFDDFLNALKQKKRKEVRRERRIVRDQGICIESLSGAELTESHAVLMYDLYLKTVDKKYAHDYLTADFFKFIVQSMPDSIVFFIAKKQGDIIAGALCLRSTDTLYGRYWGCFTDYDCLHFELCYYTAIEYAIENKLHYEAGAQGEHKITRGFSPTRIYSAHLIHQPDFKNAIGQAINMENEQLESYLKQGGNWAYKN